MWGLPLKYSYLGEQGEWYFYVQEVEVGIEVNQAGVLPPAYGHTEPVDHRHIGTRKEA